MRALILVLVLLFPLETLGQTVCGPQNYDIEEEPNFECPSPGELEMIPDLRPPPSIPVSVGATVEAPWEGALVHRDRLIRTGLTIRAIRRLRWADRLQIHAEYRIRFEHQEAVNEARLENARERTEVYREALERANARVASAQAWYRSWWFGFLSGTVVAGVLVALAAYVVTVL